MNLVILLIIQTLQTVHTESSKSPLKSPDLLADAAEYSIVANSVANTIYNTDDYDLSQTVSSQFYSDTALSLFLSMD